MNFGKLGDVVRTVLQAMRQGRIGFSVQQVNCVGEHHKVFYSECLARLIRLDGTLMTAGEFMPTLEEWEYGSELTWQGALGPPTSRDIYCRSLRCLRFVGDWHTPPLWRAGYRARVEGSRFAKIVGMTNQITVLPTTRSTSP